MKPKRFLILSASTGNGHMSASQALKEEIEAQGGVAEVVDCMDHVSRTFRRWFKGGYEMLVKRQPWFWGYLYRTSDRPLVNYSVQTLLDWKCCWPLDQVIREFKPDYVLCTHSVAQPRLPSLRKELGFRTAVVVTDLYPHRMWLRGDPDIFFVATEDSVDVLKRRLGEDQKPIVLTGIPVNSAFHKPERKAETAWKWGLDPAKPIVLLSSGGIGAGPFDDAADHLSKLNAQIVVLCGRSHETFERLTNRFASDKNVKVLGQVSQPDMAELMGLADLLIGKSGGLTTFESLACGCPFLVLWPFLIPGQEEDNANWLESIGAGKILREMDSLASTVQTLLHSPDALKSMREAAIANAKPGAAKAIIDCLNSLSGAGQEVVVLRR